MGVSWEVKLPGPLLSLEASPHKRRAVTELPLGRGSAAPAYSWCPPACTERASSVLSLPLCPQLADVESSPSKEEDEDDDDTMQNTVVLFSNTDKFVLMQVTRAWQDGQTDRVGQTLSLSCQLLSPHSRHFPPPQDMCVVCGSFGRGAEGHLLACSQCSQCYHPYCVNSKVRRGPRTPGPTGPCCAP